MQLNSTNSINIIVAPMKLPVRVTSMRSRKGLGDPPVLRGLLSSGPAMIDVQNQFFRFGDDVWIQSQNLVVLIYKMCFSDLYNFCIQGGGAYLHKEFLSCLLSTNAIGGNSFYRRFFSWSAKLVVLFEWYLSFFFLHLIHASVFCDVEIGFFRLQIASLQFAKLLICHFAKCFLRVYIILATGGFLVLYNDF